MIALAVFLGMGVVAIGLWLAIHRELFLSYLSCRRQVADECGADFRTCKFAIVEGGGRPQEIHPGVVRVGFTWLVEHDISIWPLVK